jgi:hypothetical protein
MTDCLYIHIGKVTPTVDFRLVGPYAFIGALHRDGASRTLPQRALHDTSYDLLSRKSCISPNHTLDGALLPQLFEPRDLLL